MRNIFLVLLTLSIASVYGQNTSIKLIPQPVEIIQNKGVFHLKALTTIGFNTLEGKMVAGMLADKLNEPTGFKLKTKQTKVANIQFKLNKTPIDKLGNEGYTLVSNTKGVTITANETAGLFYGMQTLLQLFPKEIESKEVTKSKWTIPAVMITDYPRFKWRGLMLDVSRHFFNKEDVKSYIDQMARFKFNTFHMHLTDDNGWRVEIKSLPKLTQVGAWRVERYGKFGQRMVPKPGELATYGGFYTQEDIKEIVRYAQDRNITIVPEIDIPGHSQAAIVSYPALSCSNDTTLGVNPGAQFEVKQSDGTYKGKVDNSLDPSKEMVYQFLDKVFTEIAALFPNPYIHVGGDECYKGFWAKNDSCIALQKRLNLPRIDDLQGYFMGRVEAILKSKGKKMLGWDENLDSGISPEGTIMSWRGMKYGIDAANLGHDVVMTPTTYAYLDYCQGDPTVDPPIYDRLRVSKCYSFEPVPSGVDSKHILGGQGNLWTEGVPTLRYAEYMTYPRGWALSEVFWSPKAKKDWSGFIPRLENQFKRSDVADLNYSKAIYDAIVKISMRNGKMVMELGSEIPDLEIFYSFDDTMPDSHSYKYIQPVELPDGPITLRVVTWRNGSPIGHLITLRPDDLKKRSTQN
jgi:hexosaminidase